MTTKNAVLASTTIAPESPSVEDVQGVKPVLSADAIKVPVFRDKEFTSRTLILSEGRTVQVVRGLVEATDPELLSFLRARSSFEPVME